MCVPVDAVVDGQAPRPILVPSTRAVAQMHVLGCDFGQQRDYSTICAVRYEERLLTLGDPLMGERPTFETHYVVLGAERLPLGTGYQEVAARVAQIAHRLYNRDSRGDYYCLCDATGVGRPVIEMVRQKMIAQCHVTAVTITGSDKGDLSILFRHEATIGKMYLVSRLQAILQGGRLHAPRDPLMEAMIEELKVFEVHRKPTGHQEAAAFDVGTHDDLVTALCLGCASEFQAVTYGPTAGNLPSPRL